MKIIYLSLFLFIPLLINAQVFDQEIITTAGEYSEKDDGSLSWTIGETIVETLTDGTNVLTQGFQQGNLEVISIIGEKELGYSFKVYPNPVIGYLTIETDKDILEFSLFDINGKLVLTDKTTGNSKTIDLTNLPSGNYILKTGNAETHKIIKE